MILSNADIIKQIKEKTYHGMRFVMAMNPAFKRSPEDVLIPDHLLTEEDIRKTIENVAVTVEKKSAGHLTKEQSIGLACCYALMTSNMSFETAKLSYEQINSKSNKKDLTTLIDATFLGCEDEKIHDEQYEIFLSMVKEIGISEEQVNLSLPVLQQENEKLILSL